MTPHLFAPCRCQLGEAPLWSAEKQSLFWIDLPTAKLWRHDFGSNETTEVTLAVEPMLGAIAPTSDPHRLLLTHKRGISLLHLETLALEDFADPEQARDGVMYNDAKIDRTGRLWAGTSHVKEQEARGALWIIDSGKHAKLVDAGFAITNGPAFSPDGRTAYVSDSLARNVFAYDIDAAGRVHGRRIFCTLSIDEGMPDGLTVDSEGLLWIAHWAGGCITRRSPQGAEILRIEVPSPHATSLTFGGEDLATLFITTAWDGADAAARQAQPEAGSTFTLRPGPRGLPEPVFSLT